MMRFFTPELYVRYNSQDDAEADRADADWERALRDYKKHLGEHLEDMNERVKDLAESLCLHDAELLSIQEDLPRPYAPPLFFTFPVATISLGDGGNITNLIYFLWSEVGQSRPVENWPFSTLRTHWLYDELDVERHPQYLPRYWHRILWSDGRVISIPFFDVIIQSFSQQDPKTAIVTKKRA
jgi:hypothetical protein